jgi:hypothetical protein
MFGPNISGRIDCQVDYHHREERFSSIYEEIVSLFRSKFHIASNYEIIIYTGSGSMAVEAFISSFKGKLRVDSIDLANEKFANRWAQLLKYYGKYDEKSHHSIKVFFETSRSQLNGDQNATFVDSVSGFPFWSAPSSPAWATVSSKMLGSAPVLGLLFLERSFMETYMEDSPSYFSPFKYLEQQKMWQTPFTPAIPLFQDLRDKLAQFNVADLRERVAARYQLLVSVIGEENLINPELSPVLTIKPGVIPLEVVDRWSLYGKTSGSNIQIFLYSESSEKYAMLADDIEKASKRVCRKSRSRSEGVAKALSPSTLI